MKRSLLILLTLLIISSAFAITKDDIRFCLDREFHEILYKHTEEIVEPIISGTADEEWTDLVIEYAKILKDTDLALESYLYKAQKFTNLDAAISWLLIAKPLAQKESSVHDYYQENLASIRSVFVNDADALVLDIYEQGLDTDAYLPRIRNLETYTKVIEELAKERIDQISVERIDSLAFGMIEQMQRDFPKSKWIQAALYFKLYHFSNAKKYEQLSEALKTIDESDLASVYVKILFMQNAGYRKSLGNSAENMHVLDEAISTIEHLLHSEFPDTIHILYDELSRDQLKAKLQIQHVKLLYYKKLASINMYGDEELLLGLFSPKDRALREMLKLLNSYHPTTNDFGERAEKAFWQAKILALEKSNKSYRQAAIQLTNCLVYGAPRKRYDVDALMLVSELHKRLKIKAPLTEWLRDLVYYKGIVFEDITNQAGLEDQRFSRVAIGDYNNDGMPDILFNGSSLYQNMGNLRFEDKTETAGLSFLQSSGALFADFNNDGTLDFVSISHNADGNGDALMKGNGDGTFVKVNAKAGDIDDSYPTEGVAWIDSNLDAYPDLYMANYEKWQVRSAYPDFFWQNDKGSFADKSLALGFRTPAYADNPGQAGRGVAPADFNNDGVQDIFVSNYRLCRNFMWVKAGESYYDLAPQLGIHGRQVHGYYGHSIGADWGDFDNDGDLDLFIANLAHPRFLEFSDISMLLRNDGMQYRVIENDTIYYWQFTDITKAAGITFDELHSDPLWFDADNDGYLDLFITSIYENDRSYLYRNNGDGTFLDVTWLSGTRVYNGWGNACADFDGDGRLDLVVGSGNGTKLLRNQSSNSNRSVMIKPIWVKEHNSENSVDSNILRLIDLSAKQEGIYPNSPAFGIRVRVNTIDKKGRPMSYIRELSSAKGTSSQSAQVLHFGIGKNKLISIERVTYDQDQD